MVTAEKPGGTLARGEAVSSIVDAVTLTKERKLLLALLGLGLGAVALDRLVLGAGSPATSADAYAIDHAEAPVGASEVPAVVRVSTAENSIRRRLEEAAGRAGVEPGVTRDAFEAPACWRPAEAEAPAEEPAATEAHRRFSERYTLGAVVGKGEKGFATLRGPSLPRGHATIYVGQSIEGHRLVALIERTAVFEGPDGRVVLELDEPALERAPISAPSDNTPESTPG